ncbi:hypothetical protein ACVOMV_31020 [Mesorhizobium atlanticum]
MGFAAQSAVCLRRGATEAALTGASVGVPIHEPLDFWYPLTPTSRLEDGRRQVSFRPPDETLSGERLHQWIGARTMVDGREPTSTACGARSCSCEPSSPKASISAQC